MASQIFAIRDDLDRAPYPVPSMLTEPFAGGGRGRPGNGLLSGKPGSQDIEVLVGQVKTSDKLPQELLAGGHQLKVIRKDARDAFQRFHLHHPRAEQPGGDHHSEGITLGIEVGLK